MNIWLTMIIAGLITYLMRLSLILLFGHFELPGWLPRILRFVPPAVLAAIITPELLMPKGSLWLSVGNLRLLAGVVAIGVAWKTRNAVVTILVGMGVLWILQLVIG